MILVLRWTWVARGAWGSNQIWNLGHTDRHTKNALMYWDPVGSNNKISAPWVNVLGSKMVVVGLPSGTNDSAVSWTLAGAVCITTSGNMYIDTDGSCVN